PLPSSPLSPPPPTSPLFPYTTLFRSRGRARPTPSAPPSSSHACPPRPSRSDCERAHDDSPPGPSLHPLRHRLRGAPGARHWAPSDRKSTRLNSSHLVISYAVFCLKKK